MLFLEGRDSSKKILCHANQHPGVAAVMELLDTTGALLSGKAVR